MCETATSTISAILVKNPLGPFKSGCIVSANKTLLTRVTRETLIKIEADDGAPIPQCAHLSDNAFVFRAPSKHIKPSTAMCYQTNLI